MHKSTRTLGIIALVVAAAGGVGAMLLGTCYTPGMESLDAQFSAIATRYNYVPLLPPLSRIELPAVTVGGGQADDHCWDGTVSSYPSFSDTHTLSARIDDEHVQTALGFLRDVGFSFSAAGRAAKSVRLSIDDWIVLEAKDLSFRWDKDECWTLLQLGIVPVVGRALQFGKVKAELLGSGESAVRVDSFDLARGGRVSATGEVGSEGRYAVSGSARSVTIGIAVWRYAVRKWSCPGSGELIMNAGGDFRALTGCPDAQGSSSTWYRLRLRSEGRDRFVVDYQRTGDASDSVRHTAVTMGLEQTVAKRLRSIDRLLVERRSDSTYAVSVIRYELHAIRAVSPDEAAYQLEETRGMLVEGRRAAESSSLSYIEHIDSLRLRLSRTADPEVSWLRTEPASAYPPRSSFPSTWVLMADTPYTEEEANQPFQPPPDFSMPADAPGPRPINGRKLSR
jgi:hypothetical protein